MKILLAPDSFKESLSAWKVCLALEKGICRVFPKAIIYKIPLADGGEGTVEALALRQRSISTKAFFCLCKKRVIGPLNEKVTAAYGLLEKGAIGIIEMASASGLHLVPPSKRNPLITTTFGTGELIKACLDKGCRHIMVGIGGSATNDGGTGMARALGIKFKDKQGREIGCGGKDLKKIEHIDMSGKDRRLEKVKVTILSDVKNPLCGPYGAARVFSPQKGACPKMVLELEQGLKHFARIIKKDLGIEIKHRPGAGAAGGLGAGLMAFLNAELIPGIDFILKLTELEKYVKKADLVITGEGKMDRQTLYGKAPAGVAKLAKKYNCPVIGIAGTLGQGHELLYQHGFTSLFSIMEKPATLSAAMEDADTLLANTAERIARLIV